MLSLVAALALEGDLDGDGRIDPIGYGERLLMWQTQATPLAFTASERIVSSHGFVPYAGGSVGDLDGDGCLDAVFPEHASMGVIVFFGEGCGR